jgi:DNA-binding NarL/FixJ family response regulator
MSMKLHVLVVEDDSFTRHLVANALVQQGFEVDECISVAEAVSFVRDREPNVVISDLDLGSGASGIDLLNLVNREYPWIGLVALSAHSKSVLAGTGSIPEGATYLVKSAITDLAEIGDAVYKSISAVAQILMPAGNQEKASDDGTLVVSAQQAEILRLMSKGLTNQAISEVRGTSLRAVETMIQRTYKALSLSTTGSNNLRVEAVSLWRQGKVQVK